MKKVVLFLAVGLLFAVNANADIKLANKVAAASAVKAQENTASTEEVVVLDESANDENWQYHKMQTLNALKDIDKKIEDAKKNNEPVAELEIQKGKLIEQLDDFDNKILEEGNDKEMLKARAGKKTNSVNWQRRKFEVLEQLKDIDNKIKAAGEDSNAKSKLEAQKNKLIDQLDDIDNQIIKTDSNSEMAKARAAKKADDVNLERQKFEVLEKLKELNKKIEAAGEDDSTKSELETQKNKLVDQLNDINDKIIKTDSTGELAKARAEAEKAEAEKAKAEKAKAEDKK